MPAKIRKASVAQFQAWPELRAELAAYTAAAAVPGTCRAVYSHLWPYLLWVRSDLAETAAAQAA